MEHDELLGVNVQFVLSVSSLTRNIMSDRYPQVLGTNVDLAWPGSSSERNTTLITSVPDIKDVSFLFVGKEWRRKGLDVAVRIVKQYREQSPGSTLTAFGVSNSEIPKSTNESSWVFPKGWVSQIPWRNYDILLHSARNEPFGMVVAEARKFGLPVLMSSKVGAGDLEFSYTTVIDIDAPVSGWVRAAKDLFSDNVRLEESKWGWNDLVNKHIEATYPQEKIWVP